MFGGERAREREREVGYVVLVNATILCIGGEVGESGRAMCGG